MPDPHERSYTLPARFGITRAEERASISFSGPLTSVDFQKANSWDALEGLAQYVSVEMSKIRDSCGPDLTLDESERDRALESFRSIGTVLMARLMGIYREIIVGPLGSGDLECGPETLPLMDIELNCVDSLVLPVEILPLAKPIGVYKHPALRDAAALAGFGAACHRPTMTRRAGADQNLLDQQAVRFYWHADLRGAREQWKWISKRFRAKGPHPGKGEDSRCLADLIMLKERGPQRDVLVAGVEHFHCHHERHISANIAQEDVLRLKPSSWPWSPEVKITAAHLAQCGKPSLAGLVFLNACSSQLVSPRAVSSFARELLLNGRNAVVTTWSDVPDDVAFTMACFFYEALLRGDTVGASLREARIRLLLEKGNPLGLLFTVYGDSQFRLTGTQKSHEDEA